MVRWLVRFGYEGTSFDGWARQPGRRTVEGELLRGWAEVPAAPTEPRLAVASRTDRGVSAVGNALALDSELAGPALLRRLNGIRPEIFFTAASPVPDGFRVRAATGRTYRYFEARSGGALSAWRRAAGLFRGTLDARSFGRSIPVGQPFWRTVEAIRVEPLGPGVMVEVRAPSFVWGMVRKIVAALRLHAAGTLELSRLDEAIHGRARLTLPLAEPEGLVLWDVDYPLRWRHSWGGPNRHQRAYLDRIQRANRMRNALVDALTAAGD